MREMPTNEMELIERAKDQMHEAKLALRQLVKTMSALTDLLHGDEHFAAESHAMEMRGAVYLALGALDQGHAVAMRALKAEYSDGGVGARATAWRGGIGRVIVVQGDALGEAADIDRSEAIFAAMKAAYGL